MRHKLRMALGYGFLVLAFIGLMLPLVPQVPFFLAAVAILGTDHVVIKWCRRQIQRVGLWKEKDLPPSGQAPQ